MEECRRMGLTVWARRKWSFYKFTVNDEQAIRRDGAVKE